MVKIDVTPYAEINGLLDELVAGIGAVLGERLVGLYLFGSLTTGDFDLASSDIDILAATRMDIEDEEFRALQRMHEDFARRHPVWDDRVEVAYIAVGGLKTYRSQMSQFSTQTTNAADAASYAQVVSKEVIAIISPGEPFHLKEAGYDWLINWYLVREKGIVLAGPAQQTLIEPISREEMLRAVRRQVGEWRTWIRHTRLRKQQAYAILTMCRALYTLSRGEIVSKRQSALWAMEELPEWAWLIERALAWRAAWREEDVDHEATLPVTLRFVHRVLDRCESTSL